LFPASFIEHNVFKIHLHCSMSLFLGPRNILSFAPFYFCLPSVGRRALRRESEALYDGHHPTSLASTQHGQGHGSCKPGDVRPHKTRSAPTPRDILPSLPSSRVQEPSATRHLDHGNSRSSQVSGGSTVLAINPSHLVTSDALTIKKESTKTFMMALG